MWLPTFWDAVITALLVGSGEAPDQGEAQPRDTAGTRTAWLRVSKNSCVGCSLHKGTRPWGKRQGWNKATHSGKGRRQAAFSFALARRTRMTKSDSWTSLFTCGADRYRVCLGKAGGSLCGGTRPWVMSPQNLFICPSASPLICPHEQSAS